MQAVHAIAAAATGSCCGLFSWAKPAASHLCVLVMEFQYFEMQ